MTEHNSGTDAEADGVANAGHLADAFIDLQELVEMHIKPGFYGTLSVSLWVRDGVVKSRRKGCEIESQKRRPAPPRRVAR